MALPTRKHSRARRDKSRTHWKLPVQLMSRCTQCAQQVRQHHVCPHCGYYRGRQVILIKPPKKKEQS